MRPSDRDAACLWDMREAARNVADFISNKTFEEYQGDLLLSSATERQVEIIGEAANRVSIEFQNGHPKIPWRKIIGQRNVLAHEYRDIAPGLIWVLATVHIRELAELLDPLVPEAPQAD